MRYAGDYQTPERMERKLAVLPLPELQGKSVLDVGCDHGFWCALAAERGARKVLGLDRNRPVRGKQTDLIALNRAAGIPNTDFEHIELGRSWKEFGEFDVVLLLSLYHHVYNLVGEHLPIWFWLWRHTRGELWWENPVDLSDGVARKDIVASRHAGYTEKDIRSAAEAYFDIEVVGPGHVPSRVVWCCRPKLPRLARLAATVRSGMGGASKAFSHANDRRIGEIEAALGVRCVPGSLNLRTEQDFWWGRDCYPADLLDVADRTKGLDSEWVKRRCRFYPVGLEGEPVYAMRFDGEGYPLTSVELISSTNLRKQLFLDNGDKIRVAGSCR